MDTLIQELNLLWKPVRPYLAKQILKIYGRQDGHILEIGPFSGLIFDLVEEKVGQSFSIAAFPRAAIDLCREEARSREMEEQIRIIESNVALTGIQDESVDLAIFRGALFFPSLFRPNLSAVYRTLRPGGIAIAGGGFGRYTPPELISQIGKRSEQLNTAMGRVRVTVENIEAQVRSSHLAQACEIVTDGGLWLVIRK